MPEEGGGIAGGLGAGRAGAKRRADRERWIWWLNEGDTVRVESGEKKVTGTVTSLVWHSGGGGLTPPDAFQMWWEDEEGAGEVEVLVHGL